MGMDESLGLELDLCLDLLWRSLRFSGVNYGLSLDLTESMNLALIHWNEAIAPSLRGSHNSLSLGGCLYHCLRLCLDLFWGYVSLLATSRRRLQLSLKLLLQLLLDLLLELCFLVRRRSGVWLFRHRCRGR